MQLLSLGLQTAIAIHPCAYCFISKDNLKNKMIDAVSERTFGNLNSENQQFIIEKGFRKDAKKYSKCLNPCLLKEIPSMPVLTKCIVP